MNQTEQQEQPEPVSQLPFEDAAQAVNDFISKMQERFGVSAILITWTCPSGESGGWVSKGDNSSVYGQCHRWMAKQDELWRKEIREA